MILRTKQMLYAEEKYENEITVTGRRNSLVIHRDHFPFLLDEPALHSQGLNFDFRLFALQVSASPSGQLVQRFLEQPPPLVNVS